MKLPVFYAALNARIWTHGLGLIILAALCRPQAKAAVLTVAVEGVHAGPGAIRVALYANADSFRHEDRALRVLSGSSRFGRRFGRVRGYPGGALRRAGLS
jgi:uncharacterized protein (DUF2141 family)